MQITEIITDETLREIREHGTPEFPFEYYLDDIDEIGQGYVEWHWHNEIEWAWVESGKVICRIGNEKIILEAGEGIFINSRVIHRFETPGGAFSQILARSRAACCCGKVQFIKNMLVL